MLELELEIGRGWLFAGRHGVDSSFSAMYIVSLIVAQLPLLLFGIRFLVLRVCGG